MNYKLVFANRAFKDIQKLPPETKKRIGKSLLRYQQDPYRHSETLRDSSLGTYRFRVGDYRIVFDLKAVKLFF